MLEKISEKNLPPSGRESYGEEGIRHLEVFTRKLATRLVSKLPEENLFPDDNHREYDEFIKRRELIDDLSDEILHMIECHHEDIAQYMGRHISFNPYFETVSTEDKTLGHQVLPARMVEFLKEVIDSWRLVV